MNGDTTKRRWRRLWPLIAKGTGFAAIALVTFATIDSVLAQIGIQGLTPALIQMLSNMFGDVAAGPLIDRLLSSDVDEKALREITLQFDSQLKLDTVRTDIAEMLSRQNSFMSVLTVALEDHENSVAERILREMARYEDFKTEELIARISIEQSESFKNLNPEIQYLADLIHTVEKRGGVLQRYINLPVQADTPPTHFRPTTAQKWGLSRLFAMLEVPLESRLPSNKREIKRFSSIHEVLEHHPRFVLIGEPGSGKTTTIQHLAMEVARKRLSAPRFNHLPMLLYLPSWSGDQSIEDFILSRWRLVPDPIGLLERGEMNLYLDGLNEMGAKGYWKASHLRDWLRSDRSPMHVIITCRTADYGTELDVGLPLIVIEDMDDSHIREFVNCYLGEDAPLLLEKLFPEVGEWGEERDLALLARNPFMLIALMIIQSSSPEKELPHEIGALIQRLVVTLWERERMRNTPGWIPICEMEERFAHLAFDMIHKEKPVEVPLDYALDHLGDPNLVRAGCGASLLATHGDRIRFYHQLIQEYFAARSFREKPVSDVLDEPIFDPDGRIAGKWDQVVMTSFGIAPNPSDLLRQILVYDPWLAQTCAMKGACIRPTFHEEITMQFETELRHWNPERRRAAAVELGKIANERAIPALLDALYNESSETRRVVAWALGQIGAPAIHALVEALFHFDFDPNLRVAVIDSLGSIGDPEAVPELLEILDDDDSDVREAVVMALGEIGDSQAVPQLLDSLYDEESVVRWSVARSLGQIGDPAAVPALIATLRADYWVRGAAAEALGKIGDSAAVPELIEHLSNTDEAWIDEHTAVCDVVAEALECIGTPEALAAVLDWRREQGDS